MRFIVVSSSSTTQLFLANKPSMGIEKFGKLVLCFLAAFESGSVASSRRKKEKKEHLKDYVVFSRWDRV